MKKVYSSENSMMAGHIKSLLELEGIPCIIKNENLAGAMGELPLNECWPEVWIRDDLSYDNAMHILKDILAPENVASQSWHCACGEEIEGQFFACWNCGSYKPGS